MSSVFKDMDQDDRLDTLERKVKKLERNVNGGSKMSGIIKDLIGMECTITAMGFMVIAVLFLTQTTSG